jgi:hypothetical protein
VNGSLHLEVGQEALLTKGLVLEYEKAVKDGTSEADTIARVSTARASPSHAQGFTTPLSTAQAPLQRDAQRRDVPCE